MTFSNWKLNESNMRRKRSRHTPKGAEPKRTILGRGDQSPNSSVTENVRGAKKDLGIIEGGAAEIYRPIWKKGKGS